MGLHECAAARPDAAARTEESKGQPEAFSGAGDATKPNDKTENTMRALFLHLSGLTTLGLLGLLATPLRAQSPADPGAPVPPVRYESIIAGTKSYRPVEPMPWPDVNRRVAPPGATNQGKEGVSPGAKDVPPPGQVKPSPKGTRPE